MCVRRELVQIIELYNNQKGNVVTWFHSSPFNSVLQVAQPQDGCHGLEIELFMRLPFVFLWVFSKVIILVPAWITVPKPTFQSSIESGNTILQFSRMHFFSRLNQKETEVIKKPWINDMRMWWVSNLFSDWLRQGSCRRSYVVSACNILWTLVCPNSATQITAKSAVLIACFWLTELVG